jgi:hypothetical protein
MTFAGLLLFELERNNSRFEAATSDFAEPETINAMSVDFTDTSFLCLPRAKCPDVTWLDFRLLILMKPPHPILPLGIGLMHLWVTGFPCFSIGCSRESRRMYFHSFCSLRVSHVSPGS